MIRKLQYTCKGVERIAQNVTTSSYASTAICITGGESASCKCETGVENNSTIGYWGSSSRHYRRAVNQQTPTRAEHPVCHSCNALSEESMLCLREKRDKGEIKQLVRHPLTCADCRISLSTSGPRWWICSKCSLECRSPVHPPWAPTAAV